MKILKYCWLKLFRRFQLNLGKSFILILFPGLLLCSTPMVDMVAAEQSGNYNTTQYKVISLSNMPAEQGMKYLANLRLGTVSQIRGTNALLITALPNELNKAAAILSLADSKDQFVVRSLFPASKVQNLPSMERIESIAATGVPGSISIGSFSSPPRDGAATRAIIDIHNNMVVVVAPASQVDTIISAVEAIVGQGLIGSNSIAVEDSRSPTGVTATEPGRNSRVTSSVVETGQKPMEVSVVDRTNNPGTLPLTRQTNYRLADVDTNSLSALSVSDLIGDGQPAKGGISEKPDTQALPSSLVPIVSSYEPPAIPNGEDVLSETLPEKLDIVYLLGLAGAYLNLDFVYDPAKVKGDVTLMLQGKLRGPIKIKDLYPLLETVLKFKGFVMTRHKGNLVTVVPQEEALDIDPALLDGVDGKIDHGDMVVTRTFRLRYIDTASAYNLLANMKLGVSITPIAETKSLIITEFAYRLPRVEALLTLVDKPGEPRKFLFRQLRYTMAKTFVPKLQTLAEQLGTVSITIAEQPVEQAAPIVRQSGETDANFQRRLAAAQQRAAQIRAQQTATARGAVQPAKITEPAVYLDADERTNRILMIGLQKQLDEVAGLIDALDVEQQDLRTLGLYKIKHVGVDEVRKKLEELGVVTARPETAAYTSRLTTTFAAGKPPVITKPEPTAAPAAAETGITSESRLEEPQIVVIEATNSLLVNATAEQHVRIATIINYVDSLAEMEEMPYQLYPLKNQSPEHLAGVIQGLIQETIRDKEGKVEQVIKREEEIVIVADPNSFSLIVYASKKNQRWIENLIEKLDKRRPQVLIDVTLVEISKADAFNYDLNLLSSVPDLTSTSGLTRTILGGADANNGNLVSKLTKSGRDRFLDFQADNGLGTGFYGDRHINALLSAMQQKNYGRILAKPKILVNDNTEGIIKTTDSTYVTKTSSIPVTSGAAGQQTTLLQTGTEFEKFDAGITLTITPHISEGDLLRLDINLTRSDFGTISGLKPPDRTESEINTNVTVPDGSTIILGGLLKLNQSKGGTKIPLLGDIPLAGGLFRSISNNDIQKKLYVFVKAEVIRPEYTTNAKDGLVQISDRNRDAFEQHEGEFQKYENWPGIKPKPVDPLKVLEAE